MTRARRYHVWAAIVAVAVSALLASDPAHAVVQGISGHTTFNFSARTDYLANPDGTYLLFWGFADDDGFNPIQGQTQYPGPTLILRQGDMVTIHLKNYLPEPVSMVFPGLEGPTTPVHDGGILRSLTHEVPPDAGVTTGTYTFTASQPGTYTYQSGTNMDRQLGMGLYGAIIVRPTMTDASCPPPTLLGAPPCRRAYETDDSIYHREYLLILSEFDSRQHVAVEYGLTYDPTDPIADYWFINGRSAMDTLTDSYAPWIPSQPYDAIVSLHPAEKILIRMINLGRDPHPFHTHGNHMNLIARDGRLLESTPGSGADLSELHFTLNIAPGQTADSIFTWRAENLGWDIFGHTSVTDPMQPGEWEPDHGTPFPVQMPYFTSLAYDEFYSGSPFLGQTGPLPADLTRDNLTGFMSFMWHSHKEGEMVNQNDFPGGMMTILFVEAPWVFIP